jgi:hypothetical protein
MRSCNDRYIDGILIVVQALLITIIISTVEYAGRRNSR